VQRPDPQYVGARYQNRRRDSIYFLFLVFDLRDRIVRSGDRVEALDQRQPFGFGGNVVEASCQPIALGARERPPTGDLGDRLGLPRPTNRRA
jgi:hypothetical protein